MEITITNILVGLTCLVSYQCFNSRNLFEKLKHSPYLENNSKEYYRLISSGFVHANWTHLLINMYVLYIFGDRIEKDLIYDFGIVLGRIYYLVIYLTTIVAADLPSFFKYKNNPHYAAIGASGATSGIVFIYCFFYPWHWLGLMLIIPIPAIVFACGYLYYSSWADKNSQDNIGHDAHFYGAIFGLLAIIVLNYSYLESFINHLLLGPTWPPPQFF